MQPEEVTALGTLQIASQPVHLLTSHSIVEHEGSPRGQSQQGQQPSAPLGPPSSSPQAPPCVASVLAARCWTLEVGLAVLLMALAAVVILALLYWALLLRHKLRVARAGNALEYWGFFRSARYDLKQPGPPEAFPLAVAAVVAPGPDVAAPLQTTDSSKTPLGPPPPVSPLPQDWPPPYSEPPPPLHPPPPLPPSPPPPPSCPSSPPSPPPSPPHHPSSPPSPPPCQPSASSGLSPPDPPPVVRSRPRPSPIPRHLTTKSLPPPPPDSPVLRAWSVPSVPYPSLPRPLHRPDASPSPPRPLSAQPLPFVHTTPPSPHLSWGACSDVDVYSRVGSMRLSRTSSHSQTQVILFEHSAV
ncbi:uncharacterized protein LOC134100893 [Sardina pilchardus]|uniref:uncharacterized protein LOC134100893 n=1 Tax=Sardina pilchardus TaxID=27697 RepID=UPI002E1250CE